MPDPEPTLLLTRPEQQSRAFLNQCEDLAKRRLPTVISPLLKIENTGDVPDLDRYATLIFTSANGVRSVLASTPLTGRTVLTVGEATAGVARVAGAKAEALGENVDAFVAAAARAEGPAVFCRGVHSRGDLAVRLRDTGLKVDEAVVYDQTAVPLSTAARRLLRGAAPVILPLFSPRTADLMSRQGPFDAPLTVIAMSEAVAAEWRRPGRVLVPEASTSEAMARLAIAQF